MYQNQLCASNISKHLQQKSQLRNNRELLSSCWKAKSSVVTVGINGCHPS